MDIWFLEHLEKFLSKFYLGHSPSSRAASRSHSNGHEKSCVAEHGECILAELVNDFGILDGADDATRVLQCGIIKRKPLRGAIFMD